MPIMKHKEQSIDTDQKSNRQKLKKRLLIAFFIIAAFCVLLLWLESAGLFPGNVFNAWRVSGYLRSQYGKQDYHIRYTSYDTAEKCYVYTCEAEGRSFEMRAARLSVKRDGYYKTFLCSPEMESLVAEQLQAVFAEAWEAYRNEAEADDPKTTLETTFSISVPKTAYPEVTVQTALEALSEYGNTLRITASLHGKAIPFDQYKGLVHDVLYILQQHAEQRPEHLQVFYYRTADSDGGSGAEQMQYESRLSGYQLDYNRDGVMNSTNTHFYVELSEKQIRDLKRYQTMRIVYICVLCATIAGLSLLWIVRRRRKRSRHLS